MHGELDVLAVQAGKRKHKSCHAAHRGRWRHWCLGGRGSCEAPGKERERLPAIATHPSSGVIHPGSSYYVDEHPFHRRGSRGTRSLLRRSWLSSLAVQWE